MTRTSRLHGFSVIELLLVIAIIGILAIVSIPNYINLTSNAQSNTIKNIAATLSMANADNYTARTINPSNGIRINNCRTVANLLQGGLPSGYSIPSRNVSVNATVTCTLNGPSSSSATFLATGIR